MILAFKLTMPNRGSWNGGWSGENRLYVITKTFTGKKKEEAKKILEKGSYHYSWGDGWGANIYIEEVTPQKAAQLRKKSHGFSGYDWMVDTIIRYGQPLASHEIAPYLEKIRA